MAHYLLGQCEYALGNLAAARERFHLTSRYGAAAEPGIAATAALSAMAIGIQIGAHDEVPLRSSADSIPNCPELRLALARYPGNWDDLRCALDLDPSLIIDAISGRIDGVEKAADTSLHSTWWPRLRYLESAGPSIERAATGLGVPCTQAGLHATISSSVVGAPSQLAQVAVAVAARRSALADLRSEVAKSTGQKESAPISFLIALAGLLLFVYSFYVKNFALFFIGPGIAILGFRLQAGERQRKSAARDARIHQAVGMIDQALVDSAPWAVVRPS